MVCTNDAWDSILWNVMFILDDNGAVEHLQNKLETIRTNIKCRERRLTYTKEQANEEVGPWLRFRRLCHQFGGTPRQLDNVGGSKIGGFGRWFSCALLFKGWPQHCPGVSKPAMIDSQNKSLR